MKVLQIIPSMNISYGGPSHFLAGLQGALEKRNVFSTVITTQNSSDASPLIQSSGMYCFERERPKSFYFSRHFGNWLKENVSSYDVIHIHSAFSFPSAAGAYYGRKEGVPYIVRPFGTLDPQGFGHHPVRKLLYFTLIEKRNLEAAAYVHCTSACEADNIRKLTRKARCEVLPLGIMMENQTDEQPFTFPAQFSGKKKILFLSRIHPRKGLEFFLDVIKELSLLRKDFVFVLAGSGDQGYTENIQKKIKAAGLNDFVFKTGEVQGAEKASLLRDSDIFVLPSKRESFGISAVEAMFFSLPVVLSEGVALQKDIASSGGGIALPLQKNQWVQSLSDLLNDDVRRRKMGMAGARLAANAFTLDRCSEKLVELYHSAIHLKKGAGKHVSFK